MRRRGLALVPVFLLSSLACDSASRRAPSSTPAAATPTPTAGLKSPIVHEAPQPADRIAPDPTRTPPGP